IECCGWVGADAYAFSGFTKGAFAIRVGPHAPIAGDRGVLMATPLPMAITVICADHEGGFDVAGLGARWAAFVESVRLLRVACAAAWLYVLVLTPAVIVWRGLSGNWGL